MKRIVFSLSFILFPVSYGVAQSFIHYTTTEAQPWQQSKASLSGKAAAEPLLTISGQERQQAGDGASEMKGHVFKAWGTCFNELDLDALELLKPEEQEQIMHDLFAPDGDLKFTRGRLTMNANDYSRAWYSCDTVAGDFGLKYFNIEHDKANVIRLIKRAQHYQPQMTFWVSPWSPPAWMKINNEYCVVSSQWNTQAKEKDYLLFDDGGMPDPDEMQFLGESRGKFPRKLASQNYLIQDPRYLQSYANMFCKFIDLYAAEQIPIDMVMYQNEAYSYTPYPGCAWTAEGTIKFNKEYLAPMLKKLHPEVKLYLGTFNTNRNDYVRKIVDGLKDDVEGLGFQWEGRENLDDMRQRYPQIHLVSSESECGSGQMNWRAGEHTFHLLCDYIGRGCDEYYIWNFILCDQGRSPWGWKQNALIQVKTANLSFRYTPEFYAVKHFSNQVAPGSRVLGYLSREQTGGMPVILFQRPDKKYVVIAGNQTDNAQTLTVKLNGKYLNIAMQPRSFHTFVEKNSRVTR